MFEQEQNVGNVFIFAERDKLLLQAETCGVVDGAELDYRDQASVGSGSSAFTKDGTEDTEELHRSFAQKTRSG